MSPVPCEGAREANSVQNDESAEPSHRAPQAAKRRLWAEQSIPTDQTEREIRGCRQRKGNNKYKYMHPVDDKNG